jgi:probable phosphoglycerate mutase
MPRCARHAQETLVLVAHDSVNRALLLQLLEQPLSAYWRTMHAPCGISEIDINAGQAQVRRMNETAHLPDLA